MTDAERNRLQKSIQQSRVYGARDNDFVAASYSDGYTVSFVNTSGERVEMPLSEVNDYA